MIGTYKRWRYRDTLGEAEIRLVSGEKRGCSGRAVQSLPGVRSGSYESHSVVDQAEAERGEESSEHDRTGERDRGEGNEAEHDHVQPPTAGPSSVHVRFGLAARFSASTVSLRGDGPECVQFRRELRTRPVGRDPLVLTADPLARWIARSSSADTLPAHVDNVAGGDGDTEAPSARICRVVTEPH